MEKPEKPHRAYRSIDSCTLATLIDSMTEQQFKARFLIIDCRYPYEFAGGHIWVGVCLPLLFFRLDLYCILQYAINLYESSAIKHYFYPEDKKPFAEMSARIPIFYCEYSQKRGPSM